MDVFTTLTCFDTWFAHHKTTCGVARFDVSVTHEPDEAAVTLLCPTCENTKQSAVGRVRARPATRRPEQKELTELAT